MHSVDWEGISWSDCASDYTPSRLGEAIGVPFGHQTPCLPPRPPAKLQKLLRESQAEKGEAVYNPEISVRVEVCQTDAPTLREWRIVLGGAVRGGLSSSHGYLPTSGPLLLDQIEEIIAGVRNLLESYAVGLGGVQMDLFEG